MLSSLPNRKLLELSWYLKFRYLLEVVGQMSRLRVVATKCLTLLVDRAVATMEELGLRTFLSFEGVQGLKFLGRLGHREILRTT